MNIRIFPSKIAGDILAPPSKSITQRAFAAALLRKGETILHHTGHSGDEQAALRIIRELGAEINFAEAGTLKIRSAFPVGGTLETVPILQCGESGLSLRMFAFIAALLRQEVVIEGEGSLKERPIQPFEAIFPKTGVSFNSRSGKLPVKIKGPLVPRDIEIDASGGSQFLTGLLLAYSASGAADISIVVNNLKSRPYIDLTLNLMKDFEMPVPENHDYKTFYFPGEERPEPASPLEYTIGSDWSNAAFLLVAGAIAGPVTVTGLDVFSAQGDKKILEALQDCGCFLSVSIDRISVRQNEKKAFHFDATHCPDLFPPLVALAVHCNGRSVIEGAHRLLHKESNRALSLQNEFRKLGIDIIIQEDKMIIPGGKITGGKVHSHNDHRIAMALAIAALDADADAAVEIEAAEAVAKSWPGFFEALRQLSVRQE